MSLVALGPLMNVSGDDGRRCDNDSGNAGDNLVGTYDDDVMVGHE